MFEQHERWLEELLEYTNRDGAVTCCSGYMPLTAITQEIAAACDDIREHTGLQAASWESMAADLSDSLDWIGPGLLSLVDTASQAVHLAITNDLLRTGPNGGRRLDDTKRPVVAAQAAALAKVLDQDDVLVAAWRDLVAACQDIDHVRYPSERIAFLRDTLVSLSEYRKQDRQYFSPISTAVQVLIGNQFSVRDAHEMVGDPVSMPFDPDAPVDLSEGERADLAARCIVERPPTGKYVVWFRLSPGFFQKVPHVTHGDITFYEAQTLASALTDHDRARRDLAGVVPEELLTDEIRGLQAENEVDEYTGFEWEPMLVYARVRVHDVERHRAVETARTHLDTVLAVVDHHKRMWNVLGGYLFFDPSPDAWNPFGARWTEAKGAQPDPVFYQNDHFATDLADFTAKGHVITAETAEKLQPSLQLLSALASTAQADSDAVVRAAVRSIEHCNTWTAPAVGRSWYAFVDEYLVDEYTLSAFARRVAFDVFAAADHYRPDRTPGAVTPSELHAIRNDIKVDNVWGTRIDASKTIAHLAELRRIYADHWLTRRLAEADDILASGATIAAAFAVEKQRVNARVKRLTRSRNATIHGGPLSEAACTTITDFATTLAKQGLNATIWAIIPGQQLDSYAISRRDDFRQRILKLQQGGDLANLFRLTP